MSNEIDGIQKIKAIKRVDNIQRKCHNYIHRGEFSQTMTQTSETPYIMSNHYKQIISVILSISMVCWAYSYNVMKAESITISDKEITEELIEYNTSKQGTSMTNAKSNIMGVKYDDLVVKYSNKYNVSYSLMNDILNCENRERDRYLQSRLLYDFTNTRLGIIQGEREYSLGVAQINLHYNPNITYEQATDPDFSIEFLAKNLSIGNGKWWACYGKVR
jgi:hypothetical protein